MNVTLILGNGFDLNMGLPTAYSDFYKYYMLVDSPRLTYLIKQGIGEKPQTWADLEKSLGENSLYAPFGSPSSGGQKPSGTRGCNRPTVLNFLPLRLSCKESSTFSPSPSSSGSGDVTALWCSEPLRYKVGGASKPSPCFAGWDRLGHKQ